ncbi:glycosyltransferase family 39 protein [Actinoplanes sp. NPDC026619]|uniref:glycosyltransferase family 39 protein n=1 Tax=Actinoplanes sp. NPDC026619 TaxID=3155798 RepID=UPI0033CD8D7B
MKLARPLSWALPALFTALVVSWRAGTPEPWRDEMASWSAAGRTVGEISELGRNIDGVTVPYYLFLHVWIGLFGDSVIAMRVPSVIAMTATAAVVALLARRWWGERAGLLAGLLFAVVPAVSRYGQEIRGYAFAALFAALATLLLAIALERWWVWTSYGLAVALTGLSHLLSLLVLTGHAVLVLVAVRRGGRLRVLWWLLALVAAAGVVLPMTSAGLGEQSAQLNWLTAATLPELARAIGAIFLVPAVTVLVGLLAVAAPRRSPGAPVLVLWSAVVLPIGTLYAYDHFVAPIFVARYLLFVVPLLCALAGAALAPFRLPWALVPVLVVAAVGAPSQRSIRRAHSSSDYRAAAEVVLTHQQAGDGIIYAPRRGWQMTDLGLEYYLGDRAPKDVLLASDEVANASLWATECADAAKCLGSTQRVWVVAADNLSPAFRATVTNQLSSSAKAALAGYQRSGSWRVRGFTVTLLTLS